MSKCSGKSFLPRNYSFRQILTRSLFCLHYKILLLSNFVICFDSAPHNNISLLFALVSYLTCLTHSSIFLFALAQFQFAQNSFFAFHLLQSEAMSSESKSADASRKPAQLPGFVSKYEGRSNGGIPCFAEERLLERASKVRL